MSKPDVTKSRWAETSGGSPRAGLVDATSGKRDVGHVDDEQPDADELSYLLNQFYQWIKLSDGEHDSAGDLVLPTNLYVKVSGTGGYKHDQKELPIPPSAFVVEAGSPVFEADDWLCSGGIVTIMAPIVLPVGKRIISLSYDRNWNGGSGLVDFVLTKTALGSGSVIDDTQISGSGSSWGTTPSTAAINRTIATGEKFHLRVNSSNTSFKMGGFSVFYDEP